MLEEVFRVAPVPEDYMKYQLHLSTGMEVPQIEQWFQNRRSGDGSSQRPLEGGPFGIISFLPVTQQASASLRSSAPRLCIYETLQGTVPLE